VIHDLNRFGIDVPEDQDIHEPVEIHVKYSGYIKRQTEMIAQAQRLEDLILPVDVIYGDVRGLSREEVEKLTSIRPTSLGQAQRISGVNPSAVQALMVYLKGRERRTPSVPPSGH
jgi:tRNA uridine 5-carboxymethylaminomethyl modification enzyme